MHFYNPADENSNLLRNDNLCLEKTFPPPVGVVEELENIYFEYDEFTLADTTFATLDKLAENLINPAGRAMNRRTEFKVLEK